MDVYEPHGRDVTGLVAGLAGRSWTAPPADRSAGRTASWKTLIPVRDRPVTSTYRVRRSRHALVAPPARD
ncbi:hypothetical protein, partial [Kitasatospora sp. NPDC007106]|uniref:hypothetical protein n=1 Tax=Kitasatospora sp. NPDC007106 TaxID=3156914 RepID=UPI0033D5CA20